MAVETELSGPDLTADGILADEITAGVPGLGHVEGKSVVVVATEDGVYAVGGSCSHYGGPLGDGLCVGAEIRCPWHHAAFDVRTGEAVSAPALNPIPIYETTERDGRIFVTGPTDAPKPKRTPPSTPESVVIVGAGAGGAAAAEAFRSHGYDGPVTLIGTEPPVDRPNLSKDHLAGTAPEEWMPLRSPQFYTHAGIDLISGEEVTAVDPAGQSRPPRTGPPALLWRTPPCHRSRTSPPPRPRRRPGSRPLSPLSRGQSLDHRLPRRHRTCGDRGSGVHRLGGGRLAPPPGDRSDGGGTRGDPPRRCGGGDAGPVCRRPPP